MEGTGTSSTRDKPSKVITEALENAVDVGNDVMVSIIYVVQSYV
jgi:hypothetical protein